MGIFHECGTGENITLYMGISIRVLLIENSIILAKSLMVHLFGLHVKLVYNM